jgi:hypothetical protein
MYAIIAGFVFTEALKDYNQYIANITLGLHSSQNGLNPISILPVLKSADVIYRLMAFFAVAVLFTM